MRLNSKQVHGLLLIFLLSIFSVTLAQESELETVNRSNIEFFIDEVYNQGDLAVINVLFAENVVGHPGERNRNEYAAGVIGLRAAMPDLIAEPTVIIVENDWVAFQLLLRGTFLNEMVFPDSEPIPPTGEAIQFVVNLALKTNPQGQVLEYWVGFDNLSFLAQIEYIPKPETLWQGNTEYVPLVQTGLEEANKLRATQYYNAWQQNDYAVLEQQLSSDFTAYSPFGSYDRQGQVTDLQAFRDAFPDYLWNFKTIIAEGNYVVVVHNIQGTFTRGFVISEDWTIPATNLPLDVTRVDFLRFDEQGLIAETWELYDVWDFLAQMQVPLFQESP